MKNTNLTEEKIDYSWFPLDNAAKIFPAVQSREHTTVFRISVILKERIRIKCLLDAIKKTDTRFPYFMVCLRKGFFWYYLEHVDKAVLPVADHYGLCRAFSHSDKNSFLFRILVVNNRISIEFSHILTDGSGANVFLSTLLTAYFNETGIVSGTDAPGFLLDTPISGQEFEDAYNRYFKVSIPHFNRYAKAFHLPFARSSPPEFNVLVAELEMDELRSAAIKKEISVTDYLVAIYLYVIQEIHLGLHRYSHKRKRKIVRVQVPINLRKIYPTRTMRNFSLFVLPEIDLRLGTYSFDEIASIVHHKMKLETDEKLINKIITRNVAAERNLLVRGIPLFIKNLILYYKYYSQGTNQYSGVLTNLGKLEFSPEIMDRIDHFVVIPPPPNRKLKINCGVVGFKDKLIISFGNITRSTELERLYVRFLISQGIHVKLKTYN